MSTPKTILIVDDSRLTRAMIAAIVRNHRPNWTIIEASNGEEALKATEDQHVDLMTLDMNMPGMDGVTLGMTLRERFPEAHIALVTANIQDAVRERARQAQLLFVPKPVNEERILGYLNTVT